MIMKTKDFTPCSEEMNSDFEHPIFYSDCVGNIYFDATSYLEQFPDKEHPKSIVDFRDKFAYPMQALSQSLAIALDDLFFVRAGTKNIMIDERMEYIFLQYLDVNFGPYMYGRMRELFTEGIAVSDHYLTLKSEERFGVEQ